MKTTVFAILILTLSVSVFGNDGVYLTKGGVIYPTQETKISLEKEILSFTVRDKVAYVDIQFKFNNPENTERKLLIGFQAPTAAGDVSDSLSNLNQINNLFNKNADSITTQGILCDACLIMCHRVHAALGLSDLDSICCLFLSGCNPLPTSLSE